MFPVSKNRLVITGLEGCGKSSKLFHQLSLDLSITPKSPILVGVKNYALMKEQIYSWAKRYSVPFEQFAICSKNSRNEDILEYLTDPENPYVLPPTAKYIFTSQANIQRNNHLDFFHPNGEFVEWKKIIIDEFDFCSGIIPSLDYELGRVTDKQAKDLATSRKLDWIQKNYTFRDRVKAHIAKSDKEFHIAEWIEKCSCPLIFLTSELLSTKILEAMGFEVFKLSDKDFKHCTVNIATFNHIHNDLFRELNQTNSWNDFKDYDLIITDKVKSYYDTKQESLSVNVLSHTAVRGSNIHRNKKILTVLSYIPSSAIQLIVDCLNYLSIKTDYKQVEALYYRDRLAQSIGRTIGYRGGKEADVIIHSQILDILASVPFPYSIKQSLKITNKKFLECIEKAEVKVRQTKLTGLMKEDDYSFLNHFFKLNEASVIPVKKVKEYLKKNHIKSKSGKGIPATTIAKHIGGKVIRKSINKKQVTCLVGVEFTNG